jgi:hypothetical protein
VQTLLSEGRFDRFVQQTIDVHQSERNELLL